MTNPPIEVPIKKRKRYYNLKKDREYKQRPEVKARIFAALVRRRETEGFKERAKASRKRYMGKPGVKERITLFRKVYDRQPKVQLRNKLYYEENKRDLSIKHILWRQDIKRKVFEKYDGCFCKNCSESTIEVLSLDHVNDDGHIERSVKGYNSNVFYLKLLKTEKRNDLQVLCMNCQFLKKSQSPKYNLNKEPYIMPQISLVEYVRRLA